MGFSTRVAALILRFLTLMLLIASLAIIATDKLHCPGFGFLCLFLLDVDPPHDLSFKDVYALRYVLSVAAVGCAYTLLVIPFAVISYAREKRIGGSATLFLIFTDLVFCMFLATGGAAGLGLVVDIQREEDDLEVLDANGKNFYDSVDASCGLLVAAAVCMVPIIMSSVHSLTK